MARSLLTSLQLVLLLVLVGCGTADSSTTLANSPTPVATGDQAAELLSCGDATWPEGGLDDLPPLDTLPEDVLDAIDDVGDPVVDASLPWRVALHDGPDVVLVRAIEPDEADAASGATHAALSLFRVDGSSVLPPGTWHYGSLDECTPRRAEGNEGGPAEVRLAEAPSTADTSLQVLVMERNCAGGQSAEGRVRVDELTLTDTQVRLRVSVTPPPGDAHTCPSNPWTPLGIDLGQPIGDRTVVDANVVPAAEVLVGTDDADQMGNEG